ncbi:MAG: SPASM domain-containing protein [Methanosarcinaceae archaeon]|jgi:radical SAM protein with 4Fe4S-binding SPASM domain|nr:SPASM domain-containing protein [Methanosarcinaceae archaeon]NKQ39930.1 SPASM domain-containing protein [Methanosarcinales archaeon]
MVNLYTRIPKGVCNTTVNIEAFGQDGAIYPCQRFLSNPEFEYGNVNKGYNNEKLDKIKKKECFFDSYCAKCWMKVFCSGKCAYLQTIPNSNEKHKLDCIIQSIMWDSVIEFFIEINNESQESIDEFFKIKANIY